MGTVCEAPLLRPDQSELLMSGDVRSCWKRWPGCETYRRGWELLLLLPCI